MLQFSFLPRTTLAFQQARRRALHHSFLLGRAALFVYKITNVFRTTHGRAAPLEREEMAVISVETLDSGGSQFMAVGLSGQLASDGVTGPANRAAYVALQPDGKGCRLPTATCSPMTVEFVGRDADPPPGAGRLVADCIRPPELTSSLVLRLLASCWEIPAPLPDIVLRLPAGTADFFLLAVACHSSLRRASECLNV